MAQFKISTWWRMGGKWNLNGKWMQMLPTFILLIQTKKDLSEIFIFDSSINYSEFDFYADLYDIKSQ